MFVVCFSFLIRSVFRLKADAAAAAAAATAPVDVDDDDDDKLCNRANLSRD